MQLPLYSEQGKKLAKKITVSDVIFRIPVRRELIRQALHVYTSNQRQSTAHVKTRGEVRGGGTKPWAQKGSGRARAGSIRSPIWKGGGVTFGPRKERNFKKIMSKKMKKAAIRSVFSLLAKEDRLYIVEKVAIKGPHLTKEVIYFVAKLGLKGKVLIIQSGENKNLYLGSRNVKNITVITINEVNVFDLLNHNYVIILSDVLQKMDVYWGGGKKVAEQDQKPKTKREKRSISKDLISDSKLPSRIKTILNREGITSKKKLEEILKEGKKIKGIGDKGLEQIKKVYSIS